MRGNDEFDADKHPVDIDGVSVHSGFPNPATDRAFATLNLNQLLIEHTASTYYFRIAGNDWNDIGVFDGDIAIIDRALNAKPGDLVVWWHGDSAEFAISTGKQMPKDAAAWGVITATIHQFRKVNR